MHVGGAVGGVLVPSAAKVQRVCRPAAPRSASCKLHATKQQQGAQGTPPAAKQASTPKPPQGRKPAPAKKAKPQKGGAAGSKASAASAEPCGVRLYDIKVPMDVDPGKDDSSVHPALVRAVAQRLNCKLSELQAQAQAQQLSLVRKSFDARGAKSWQYVVDVSTEAVQRLRAAKAMGVPAFKEGQVERNQQEPALTPPPALGVAEKHRRRDPVVVVGSGPAGLFAALSAASAGLPVVLLEKGQPVEQRGRDIGALFARGKLNPDSNLCYGEGGAGTWSDGKLTTRIGRNSDPVRRVLQTLVQFGAPESILVAGKPHLGTERLVRLLKEFRSHLQSLGVVVRFGTNVEDLVVEGGRCRGVLLRGGERLDASAVVLAVGHSARALYHTLQQQGVTLSAKPFAMGFRIEHPQSLIDTIRYGPRDAAGVMRGKGKLPVADYTLAVQVLDALGEPMSNTVSTSTSDASNSTTSTTATSSRGSGGGVRAARSSSAAPGALEGGNRAAALDAAQASPGVAAVGEQDGGQGQAGSSGRGGGDGGGGGAAGAGNERGVFSFCMCPGGQIVPTSTNPEELCINGMSFSRRNSLWANSALVVTVQPHDWQHLVQEHGPLAGLALQVQYERLGAKMGGDNFVAPVQRVPDFLEGVASQGELPSSSYRLGVRAAPLHELYAPDLTESLRRAITKFERRMPGFAGPQGLLHGVETRTSSPVRIDRLDDSLQSVNMPGLYPCGEGAGYAGGIVSAAVDGLKVGEVVAAMLLAE